MDREAAAATRSRRAPLGGALRRSRPDAAAAAAAAGVAGGIVGRAGVGGGIVAAPVGAPVLPIDEPGVGRGPGLRPGRESRSPVGAGEPSREELLPARGRRRTRSAEWPQSRWMIRHLNVWTVIKVSVAFYVLLLAAFVIASVILYYIANTFGAVDSIEKSARTLFSLKSVSIHPGIVAEYTALGGAVLCVVGTFVNVLAALMYNLISDLVGGIRFTVVDTQR
jgi:hypothetical protein